MRLLIEIEAEQFFHGQDPETYPPDIQWSEKDGAYILSALDGTHIVSDGDWIVTGIKGERYPCKPDVSEDRQLSPEEIQFWSQALGQLLAGVESDQNA
jgi:hypothetical protein